MSLSDFMQFYRTIASVIVGFWNVLESLKIAGIGLGSWSIGFFLLDIVIRIFFKVTTGGLGVVPQTSGSVQSYVKRNNFNENQKFSSFQEYQYLKQMHNLKYRS